MRAFRLYGYLTTDLQEIIYIYIIRNNKGNKISHAFMLITFISSYLLNCYSTFALFIGTWRNLLVFTLSINKTAAHPSLKLLRHSSSRNFDSFIFSSNICDDRSLQCSSSFFFSSPSIIHCFYAASKSS